MLFDHNLRVYSFTLGKFRSVPVLSCKYQSWNIYYCWKLWATFGRNYNFLFQHLVTLSITNVVLPSWRWTIQFILHTIFFTDFPTTTTTTTTPTTVATSSTTSFNDVIVTGFLTAWDKLGIMSLGGLVVGLTVLAVVCAVGPGCCLHKMFNRAGEWKSNKRIGQWLWLSW